jgi:hypothetical protein
MPVSVRRAWHGSTEITEGHDIEPDRTVDHGPA